MTSHSGADPAIGYWLSKAETLLSERIGAVQRDCGLSALDWQILSLVHERPRIQRIELIELMSLHAGDPVIESRLELMGVNNLLTVTNESIYELSERGEEVYRCAQVSQQEVRQLAMQDISAEDQRIAIQVLQQIATNLGNPGEGPDSQSSPQRI